MVYFFHISPELGRQIASKMMVFTDVKAIIDAGIDCQLEPFWDLDEDSLKVNLMIGNGRVTRSNICFHVKHVIQDFRSDPYDLDRTTVWYPTPGREIEVY